MTFSEAYQIAGSLRNEVNSVDEIITTMYSGISSVNNGQSGILPEKITQRIKTQITLLEGIKDDIVSASVIVRRYGDTLLNAQKRVTNPNSKIQQRVTGKNEVKKVQGKLVNIEQTK